MFINNQNVWFNFIQIIKMYCFYLYSRNKKVRIVSVLNPWRRTKKVLELFVRAWFCYLGSKKCWIKSIIRAGSLLWRSQSIKIDDHLVCSVSQLAIRPILYDFDQKRDDGWQCSSSIRIMCRYQRRHQSTKALSIILCVAHQSRRKAGQHLVSWHYVTERTERTEQSFSGKFSMSQNQTYLI